MAGRLHRHLIIILPFTAMTTAAAATAAEITLAVGVVRPLASSSCQSRRKLIRGNIIKAIRSRWRALCQNLHSWGIILSPGLVTGRGGSLGGVGLRNRW